MALIYFSPFQLRCVMHIRLSREILEPDWVGRVIPLHLALAELLGWHNSRTSGPAMLWPGKRVLPTTGLQKQAENLSMQATKSKVTTVGFRNNRREKIWLLTLKPALWRS